MICGRIRGNTARAKPFLGRGDKRMLNKTFLCTGLIIGMMIGSVRCQTVTINGVSQPTLWLVDDAGKLKSEAVLAINSDRALPAWAKISVPGQAAYMESL